MKNHRLLLLALFATTLCGGCAAPEAPVSAAPATVSEIDAQTQKIKDNTNMPPQAKERVLARLQKERDTAAKTDTIAK